ncbi:hypothetical protein DY000_02057259 [Brassica cretica]|uniref:F-box domain-containing protein n=1 Tax=Brassica cretica TaxID=69181 RepID=A0ABQ7A8G3_BRACR|nr:hypothetical protein DY000_02057259 [Brassica cretica]
MAAISDIPDGDNGGAPNKKPQEPAGEVETATSLESLPDVLIEHIIARVPRSNHPEMSLVSKLFRRIIASPGLRLTRSKLAISEHVLYALLAFPPHPPSWHILYRSNASLRLRRVTTLPLMPYGSAVVTIGHDIYVIGGSDGTRYLSSVTVVDCRTHTCRSLPSMRVARFRAAAGVIDGKIYVMGGCENRISKDWVELFDLERQIWLGTGAEDSDVSGGFVTYDVVKDKIYVLGRRQSLHVCEPKEGRIIIWEGAASELTGLWQGSSCVVDDLLYTIDPMCWRGHPIIVFDPEEGVVEGVWKPVKGVYGLPPCFHWYAYESRMANVGGKLVILVGNQSQLWNYYGDKYIWCVEIALERRQGGEIWGRVESVDVVFKTTESSPIIELCRTVIV